MKPISLFAEENRLQKLSEHGDCRERLKIIDRGSFRPTIYHTLSGLSGNGRLICQYQEDGSSRQHKGNRAVLTERHDPPCPDYFAARPLLSSSPSKVSLVRNRSEMHQMPASATTV